jgi:pyruvate dehydrogenase phosphatase
MDTSKCSACRTLYSSKFWSNSGSGFATSVVLRRYLTSTVAQELRKVPRSKFNDCGTVDAAIGSAFLQLDQRISSVALGASGEATSLYGGFDCIEPAKQGSSALLAIYDPVASYLRVACVGDSRCVLGRRNSEGLRTAHSYSEWTALALTEDQTPENESERDRICNEHPGEYGVFGPGNRDMLGLQVTRSFGDNRHKWPHRDLLALRDRVKGDWILKDVCSPPYVTAEPVVSTTEVEAGDFVILASAGLWKHISSEDAVKCIGMWIEQQKRGGISVDSDDDGSSTDASETQSPTSSSPPLEKKAPINFKDWKMVSVEGFVVEDNNAATHLARNVLGGKQKELFRSLMSLRSPDSVGVRDDITVQVIFFGDARMKRSYYSTPSVSSLFASTPEPNILDVEG